MTDQGFVFTEYRDHYEIHGDNIERIRNRDPLAGKIRYGTVNSTEIDKPIDQVRSILFDQRNLQYWHPYVQTADLEDDTIYEGAGVVSRITFYPELQEQNAKMRARGVPVVYEQVTYESDDRLITQWESKSLPFMYTSLGTVFYLKELDNDATLLVLTQTYRPRFMPFSRKLATGRWKTQSAREGYVVAWCIKHHCETGEVCKYDMAPNIGEMEEYQYDERDAISMCSFTSGPSDVQSDDGDFEEQKLPSSEPPKRNERRQASNYGNFINSANDAEYGDDNDNGDNDDDEGSYNHFAKLAEAVDDDDDDDCWNC